MGSENIFDIWRFLGKGIPFIVRRNGWFHLSYEVTKVVPKGKIWLVAGIYEPRLDELHQFAADAAMGEVHIDAQPPNQHARIAAHLLGMGMFFCTFFSLLLGSISTRILSLESVNAQTMTDISLSNLKQ